MCKAPLLYEGIKDLRVKEELEERPLGGRTVFQEELLVEQVGHFSGAFGWGGE